MKSLPALFAAVVAVNSLMVSAVEAEEGLWQRFNKSVTEGSKELGKGVKQGGKAAVQGARKGSKEANDALAGKGGNKKGSSDKQ